MDSFRLAISARPPASPSTPGSAPWTGTRAATGARIRGSLTGSRELGHRGDVGDLVTDHPQRRIEPAGPGLRGDLLRRRQHFVEQHGRQRGHVVVGVVVGDQHQGCPARRRTRPGRTRSPRRPHQRSRPSSKSYPPIPKALSAFRVEAACVGVGIPTQVESSSASWATTALLGAPQMLRTRSGSRCVVLTSLPSSFTFRRRGGWTGLMIEPSAAGNRGRILGLFSGVVPLRLPGSLCLITATSSPVANRRCGALFDGAQPTGRSPGAPGHWHPAES